MKAVRPIVRRSILFFALVLALVVGSGTLLAFHTFTDVSTNDWAHDDIAWLSDTGLTNGCGDGTTFCPNDNVTRREIAAFTHRQQLLLGSRHADEVHETDVPMADDTDTLLATVYITVPTAGGAVTTTAYAGFEGGAGDQVGWVWIEVNNDGACDGTNRIGATADYSTYATGFASPVVLGGFSALVGEKRLDVCAWGLGTSTAWETRIQATWIAAGPTGEDFEVSSSSISGPDDLERLKDAMAKRVAGD